MVRIHHGGTSAFAVYVLLAGLLLANTANAEIPTESATSETPAPTRSANASVAATTEPALTSMPSSPGPHRLDPEANRVLRAWSDFLRAADRFEANVQTDIRVRGADVTTQLKSAYHLAVERPNRIALRPQKQGFDPTVVSDGKTLSSLIPDANQYAQEPAPESLDRLLAGSTAKVLLAGGSALAHLTMLLARDPYDDLTILATGGRYVGTEDVDGTPCHHVTLLQHYFEFELWIETGPRPLLRKLVPSIITLPQSTTTAPVMAEAPLPVPNVRLETMLTFSNWSVGTPLSPDLFRFAPPPGTRRVDRLLAAAGSENPDPLVGRPAPAFAIRLLDGSIFDLAAHKGRDIVVLDFWASRPVGSAERLPALARLAKDFAGRRVVFLTLNVGDTEQFARTFLDKSKVDLPGAIDRKTDIAKLYDVRNLPRTVLIGFDGRVHAVHGSLPADIKVDLRAEIENLLVQRNLAPQIGPTTSSPSRPPGL